MLHGNPDACERALAKAGLGWDDMEVIEVNEAFASVVLQFLADTGLKERYEAGDVNPNGGGISLGHPLGATGARITATLVSELERRNARYGIAAMCIGFGQAIAGVVEAAVETTAGRLRRAHVALAVLFVVFGTLDGTWAARLPALKERLGLDSGKLGVVVFLVSLTATLLLPVAGWLAARRGSRMPTALGLFLAAVGITGAAFAPSFGTVVPAALVIGAGWGIADVAANAHGVALEEKLGRPILSVLHGMWSFGLLAGSGIAAGAAAASISPRWQFPVVCGAALVVVALFTPRLLPGTAADVDSAHFALPRGALALPAFLTFCALFVEFAAINWTAVFLTGPVRASAAVAAAGVVVYALAMAFARLAGDRLLLQWASDVSRAGAAC